MKNKNVKVADWGSLSYEEAWQRQEDYFSQIIARKGENRKLQRPFPTNNYLFLVAHPPVFTIGKSGKMEHLLLGEKQLETKGISFFKTNRGGDITFHGPGQIVGYPLLDLDNFLQISTATCVLWRRLSSKPCPTSGSTEPEVMEKQGVVGFEYSFCPKNMRYGCKSQPLGNHAWICLQCEH